MGKRKTILQSQFPYHLTARSINKEHFLIDKKILWKIFSDYLFFIKYEFKTRIHSFVLMDNHFHLIMSTPEANLSDCMNYFMREISKEVARNNNRINQTFGGPYHWCILDSYNYYLNAYKYVYRNPVEAGLVNDCGSYESSTIFGLLGKSKIFIPIEEDTLLFDGDISKTLSWLNQAHPTHTSAVKKSLKKKYFRFPKNNFTGKAEFASNFVF